MQTIKSLKNKLFVMAHWVIMFITSHLPIVPYNPSPKKVLIVRIDSIGDFVIFTTTLKYLREKYQTAEISLICNKYVAELAETSPYIDQVIIFDRKQYTYNPFYLLSFLLNLRRQHFDVSLHPVYSREVFGDELAIYGSQAQRIAFKGDNSNIANNQRLKNNKLYTTLVEILPEHVCEIDRYLDLLTGLNILPDKALKPELWLEEKDRQKAQEILSSQGIDLSKHRFCLLFPGAKNIIRSWSLAKYAQLGDLLCKNNNIKILIGGSNTEIELAQELASQMVNPAYIIAGKTSLREITAILAFATSYIGSETGILHIAAAMGTPTVCIMGGGHFGRFFPYGDESKNKIVYNKLDCFNCNWQCIYDKPKCIESIEVAQVYEAVKTVLNT